MSNVFSTEAEDYYVRFYSREKTQDQYWKGVCEEWIQTLPLKMMWRGSRSKVSVCSMNRGVVIYRVFTYITVILGITLQPLYLFPSFLAKRCIVILRIFWGMDDPETPSIHFSSLFYTLQNTHFVWTHFSDPLQTWISRWIRVISSPNLNRSMFEWYRVDV